MTLDQELDQLTLSQKNQKQDEDELGIKFNIHEIVENGNFDLFKYVVDKDINLIDSTDDFYARTPLIICSFKKQSDSHFKIAKYLIDCGCDVNVQANYKWNSWTALMTSCHYGNTKMVELLVNANANLDLTDLNSHTAWQLALENSYNDCIQIILNEMENKLTESRLKYEKELQDAVFNNDYNETKACLNKISKENIKQVINSATSGNHTLLYRACRNGNLEICELLIKYGAIAKPHYYTKYSPLYIACHMGKYEIAKLVLQNFSHLIQVITIEKFLPYHAACSQGHLDILKLLIDFGIQSSKNILSKTAKAQSSHTDDSDDNLILLHKIFTDQNNNNNNNNNINDNISSSESKKYLFLFDLNSVDVNDQSALYAAVQTNRYEICEYLLNIRVKKLTQKDITNFERKYKECKNTILRKKSSINNLYVSNNAQESSLSFSSALLSFISNEELPNNNNNNNTSSISTSVSFFDQLKNVFLDNAVEKKNELNTPKIIEDIKIDDAEDDEQNKSEYNEIATYFNPININRYSKFGSTCLHEAIKSKNHKLISLLLNHGANVHLPIYDVNSSNLDLNDTSLMNKQSNYKIMSNCLCEALKQCDENIFFLIYNKYDDKSLQNHNENNDDIKLALELCLKNFQEDNSNLKAFSRKMLPYLLKFRLQNDFESKSLNLRSKISQKIKQSLITSLQNSSNGGEILNSNFDFGLIFNLSNLKLEELYESWLINAVKYFKFSQDNFYSTNSKPSQITDDTINSNQHQTMSTTQTITIKKLYLHSITRIELSHNSLEQIPICLFEIESLKSMKLSFNKLTKLPQSKHDHFDDTNTKAYNDSFEWACHQLEELHLDNNQLSEIPSQVFKLRSLKHLNLSSNQIEKIPVEMWSAPMLFDFNLSFNKITHLPILNCSSKMSNKNSRSRRTNSSVINKQEVKDHPLKSFESIDNENQIQTNDNKTKLDSLIEYEDKPIIKANFWQSNHHNDIISNISDDTDENKVSANKSNKDSNNGSTCKLIELNLSNNQLNKIPSCLSCLAPKLLKLNLSFNKIESMGAVSDLPQSLKFLDLSNNFIKRPMRLLNESLLKFIVYYFKTQSNSVTASYEQTSHLLNLIDNFLVDNEFCYLSLVKESLQMTKSNSNPNDISKLKSRYFNNADNRLTQNNFTTNNYDPRNSANTKSNKLRSTSKRRTRSQSRNHRIMLPTLASSNQSEFLSQSYQSDPITQLNTQANAINKRILPFDLFLINFKYNKSYDTTSPKLQDIQTIQIIEQLLTKTNEDLFESELINYEKTLLNSQNLQIFLEQICEHKRHVKLDNLKSLNLSSNRLKKFQLIFDLAPSILDLSNDVSLISPSPSNYSMSSQKKDSDDESTADENSDSSSPSETEENDLNYYKGVKISSSLNVENNFVIVDASSKYVKKTNSSKLKLKDKLNNFSPLKKKTSEKPQQQQQQQSQKDLQQKLQSQNNNKKLVLYPNLTHLDLSLNKIKFLTGDLSRLDNLSYLNCSQNPNLQKVSPKIGLLTKLWNFDLKMCPNLVEPAMLDSLIKQRTKTSDILGFLKSILEHSRPYTRLKLMFVGVQAIGKTSLLNKLKEEGIQQQQQNQSNRNNISTVGIDINEWIYEKPKSSSTATSSLTNINSQQSLFIYQLDDASNSSISPKHFGPITYRTWDFAGQREYYSTHQYFLSKRALYLVCWKLTEEEKGIKEISHWLTNIQIRAPGSPVIIVGTHQDQLAKLKNYKEISTYLQKLIYDRFVRPSNEAESSSSAYPPIMASIEISSKTGFNIKLLARLIYDVSSQMKLPGGQLLLEQKIPVTYLALEECVYFILAKLKQQSRNPILNTSNYLKEIRFAIENKKFTNNQQIKFRDDAEILQATQFLHENGILIHYNDAALRDLFFLDPQWLCDLLSQVVTIREINPFGAKGIMKINDLSVLFKGTRFVCEGEKEIMSFIVDLLGKFELALTWDNYHLIIPSLLPTEQMLKFSKQDIRISIVSEKQQNQKSSIVFREKQNSDIKFINSFSQINLNKTSANNEKSQNLFECKPIISNDTNNNNSSIRRLYCLNYIPNGFFSRLITRILSDNILKDTLNDLIDLDYCLFDNNSLMTNFDKINEPLNSLMNEFLTQEAEWKCWQTGIELKYLDYTLIRCKQLIQDPTEDINDESDLITNQQYNHILYRDCENEFKLKSVRNNVSLIECYASFKNFKIVKSKHFNKILNINESEKDKDNNDDDDDLIRILCNRQICIKIFALILEIIDTLLEDWYPDLGTRFMQDSKGDYLVTRLAPCQQCIRLNYHNILVKSRNNKIKSRSRTLSTSNSLFLDPFSLSSTEETNTNNHSLQSSKSVYNYKENNNNANGLINVLPDHEILIEDENIDEEELSFLDDQEDKLKLKQFQDVKNWVFCFMIDDLCYSVLKTEPIKCPRHGCQNARILAPDLAFEDIEDRFIIEADQLKIESLLGRGSFGSVFMGSLTFKENTKLQIQNPIMINRQKSQQEDEITNNNKKVKCAVKVLETLPSNPSVVDIKNKFNEMLVNNSNNVGPLESTPKKSNVYNELSNINNEDMVNKRELFSRHWNYRKSIQLAAKAYTIARQEIAIISSLKHENIVAMIGLSIQPLAIILELAPLGNLKDILQDYKKNMVRINPFVIQNCAKQISSALVYLHSNRIIYRDLKADNILVWKFPKNSQSTLNEANNNSSVFLKLADYSISRCVLPTGTKGFAGTPGFMAPEILKFNGEETYSEKVDCFSFSMLLYELISLKHPFEEQEQIKEIILNGGRPLIKSQEMTYPTLMLDLMCLCWLDNPAERPSAADIFKYTNSYEFSHLLDVTILEDYEQKPLVVSCLNQEMDVNEELDQYYGQNKTNMDYEDQEDIEIEEEEEDVIDIWVVRNNSDDSNLVMSQMEILTYENKLNCTNRKLINICKNKIEAMCIYEGDEIWCIDALKNIYVYSCKSYNKINQLSLDVNSFNSDVISMHSLETTKQILICSTNGTLVFIDLSKKNTRQLEYAVYDLSIKVFSVIILPTRYDKNYDLWLGSENGEIYCFSFKSMNLTAKFLHSSSHHYLSSTLTTATTTTTTTTTRANSLPSETNSSAVTLIKTSQNDTFFLWSYCYPGSTIFLWNYVSKKIMSAYNCHKALDELNFKYSNSSREFRMADMTFLNGHLYCAISSGTILVFKRLTLTPLFAFNAHMHQLYNLCSLTFETKSIAYTKLSNGLIKNKTTQVKRTQNLMLTLGRALAPLHEDLYLSSSKYRVDALRKYANCLILNTWNTNSNNYSND